MYPLKLIPCRKGSRSHVGSSPTIFTKKILNKCLEYKIFICIFAKKLKIYMASPGSVWVEVDNSLLINKYNSPGSLGGRSSTHLQH